MGFPTRHLSRFIPRPVSEVIAFAGEPENLPKWAQGLSAGIRKENGEWVTDSPMGKVIVRFSPGREHGVLDHHVVLPDGKTFYNPLRVFDNDGGSEVVFTLFRLPGVTDEAYAKDAATITGDLERLEKALK